MSDKSLIRTWKGKAATFVEEARDGTVVVTVNDDRCEMNKREWEQLSSHKGEIPKNFDKPDLTPTGRS